MSNKELVTAAIAKLREAQVEIDDDAKIQTVCREIGVLIGVKRKNRETTADYIIDFLRRQKERPVIKDAFVPQKATAPNWGRRPEYKPPSHFRDAEIDALLRPISMSGPGLGDNSGYGRGR